MAIRITLLAGLLFLVAPWSRGAELAPTGIERRTEPIVLPGASEIDDPLTSLTPRHERSELDEERVEALALFAAARTEEDRGNEHEALRLYQRAFRRDPDSLAPLQQIVPLAFRVGQSQVALRYAVKVAERGEPELSLLRQLGAFLTEQGSDDDAAMRLLKRAAQVAAQSNAPGEQYVFLAKLVRLYHRNGHAKEAADALAKVEDALENRKLHGLTEDFAQEILAEPDRSDEIFGEIYLAGNDLKRARDAFARAFAIDNGPAHFFRDAQLAVAAGDDAAALRALDQYFALKDNALHEAPYRLLAEIYARQGRQGDLTAKLEELYGADAANVALATYLADQYLAAEDWEKAAPLLQGLLSGDTHLTAARGLAEVYRRTHQHAPLLDLLGDVATGDDGLEGLGRRVVEIAEDAPALDALVAAARARTRSKDAPLTFGQAYAMALLALESKRLDLAEEFFEQALPLTTDKQAETVLTWGLGLLMAEDYPRAAKVFQRGIDDRLLPADNPAFHFYLAGALEMQGKTDEALTAAREAAESADRLPRLAARVPWIQYHAKRYEDAEQGYRELIEQYDDEQRSLEVRELMRDARSALSNICVMQKKLSEAEEWLEQALDEFPDDAGALNDLGYLWADQNKRLNRAYAMLQIAVQKQPDNPAYRDSLGWVLFRLGRHEEALVELQKAAVGENIDGVIFDHLADVQHALGRHDSARDAWTKALAAFERDHEPEQAKAIKKKLEAAAPESQSE